MPSVHDFSAVRLDGSEQKLSDYAGQVLLIVNTASECGFTPQYAGLQALYERFHDRRFSVLGFPCNQFGGQEPGNEAEIGQFCTTRFGVSFPMFARIDVNGAQAHPLYAYLTHEKPGVLNTERIKWNFTKFLVDPQGAVVDRYAPATRPAALVDAIERLLPRSDQSAWQL